MENAEYEHDEIVKRYCRYTYESTMVTNGH